MNMIGHNTQFFYLDVMPNCNFFQNFFTKLFIFLFNEHIVSILRTPFQMVQILANAMATANQFHILSRPEQVI